MNVLQPSHLIMFSTNIMVVTGLSVTIRVSTKLRNIQSRLNMSTNYRNTAVYSIALGAFCLSLHALAEPDCNDDSLKALDRLKLRLETSVSLSAEELRCIAIKKSIERYRSEDATYYDQQSNDANFRNGREDPASQQTTTTLNSNISVATYKTEDEKPKSQPLITVKGYKSVVREP
jgi:hypothetical protein